MGSRFPVRRWPVVTISQSTARAHTCDVVEKRDVQTFEDSEDTGEKTYLARAGRLTRKVLV